MVRIATVTKGSATPRWIKRASTLAMWEVMPALSRMATVQSMAPSLRQCNTRAAKLQLLCHRSPPDPRVEPLTRPGCSKRKVLEVWSRTSSCTRTWRPTLRKMSTLHAFLANTASVSMINCSTTSTTVASSPATEPTFRTQVVTRNRLCSIWTKKDASSRCLTNLLALSWPPMASTWSIQRELEWSAPCPRMDMVMSGTQLPRAKQKMTWNVLSSTTQATSWLTPSMANCLKLTNAPANLLPQATARSMLSLPTRWLIRTLLTTSIVKLPSSKRRASRPTRDNRLEAHLTLLCPSSLRDSQLLRKNSLTAKRRELIRFFLSTW